MKRTKREKQKAWIGKKNKKAIFFRITLDKDEYIVKEIPLQFEEDSDTIRMSNYYVLYEMIAVVGESDE